MKIVTNSFWNSFDEKLDCITKCFCLCQLLFWESHWPKCDRNGISTKFRQILIRFVYIAFDRQQRKRYHIAP